MDIEKLHEAIKKDFEEHPKSTRMGRCKRIGVCDTTLRKNLRAMGLLKQRIKRGELGSALLKDVQAYPGATDVERAIRLGASVDYIYVLRKKLLITQNNRRDIRTLLIADIKEHPKSTGAERSYRLKTYNASVYKNIKKLEDEGVIKKLEDGSYKILKSQ